MTLRQFWVRFLALPAESWLKSAMRDDVANEELDQQARDIDDTLGMFSN